MMLTQNMEAKNSGSRQALKKTSTTQRPFFASLIGCQQRWTVHVVHKVTIHAQNI
jgi:hypothetical protein